MGATLNLSLTEDVSKSVTGDLPATTFTAAKYKGLYGTLAVNKAGLTTQTTTYTPDVRIQTLKHGQVLTETLAVGAPDVSITLTGVNDAAKFSGSLAGKLLEGQKTYVVGGPVKVLDLDAGEATILGFLKTGEDGAPSVGTSLTTEYGVFAWDSTLSKWTFSGNSEAIADLADKQTATAEAYLVSADGSRAKLSVLITGKDAATAGGGNVIGEVTEDVYPGISFLTSKGLLKIDSDDAGSSALSGSFLDKSYFSKLGSLHVHADGSWNYQVANLMPAVQKLKGGQSVLDSFAVSHANGSTKKVSVRVNGSNTETGGGFAEIAVKSGSTSDVTVKGNIVLYETNFKIPGLSSMFSHLTLEQRTRKGDYGTFVLNVNGTWAYTLDGDAPAIQNLSGGQFLTDGILAGSIYNLSIRIIGANDKALIADPGAPKSIVEDDVLLVDGRYLKTSGQLTITDPDSGEALFKASTFTDKNGTFSIGADGRWEFLADNFNPLIQKLAAGQSLKATYTVESFDGTAKSTVTININGASGGSATTFSGNEGAVTDGGLEQYTGQIFDLDAGNKIPKVKVAKTLDTEHGFFGLNLDGSWSYKLDADAVISEKTQEQFTVDVYGTETIVDDVTFTVNLFPNDLPVV